jgi:Domain of unknown function (DUF4198)
MAQRLRPVGGADAGVVALVLDVERDAALLYRRELRAAAHRRDIRAGGGEPCGEMSADRAGAEDRCLHPRSLFPWRAMTTLRLFALVLAALLSCKSPAAAFDLFATHEVNVQFATADGKPMADAEVSVYAPGDLTHPAKTGKTDKDGKFAFGTDRDGLWTARAHISGEVASVSIRVGGGAVEERGGDLSPYWVFGALGVLLAMAVVFRFLRARERRRRRR